MGSGQYKVNIGRIVHGWQAGAGDIMYTIRRRHRYAIVVVTVEPKASAGIKEHALL